MANEIEFSPGSINQLVEALGKMEGALDRVERAVNNLSSSVQKNVFEKVFGTQAQIDDLIDKLGKVSSVGVANLDSLSLTLRRVVKAFNELSTGDFKAADTNKFIEKYTDLLDKLEKLASNTQAMTNFGNVEVLTEVMAKLGSAVRNLTSKSKDFNSKQISEVIETFAKLGIGLRGLASVVNVLPGAQAFNELGETFNNIGAAFGTLGRSSRYFNDAVINKIIGVFAKLGVGLRGLALVLRVLPGNAAVRDMAETFKNIATATNEILKVGRNSRKRDISQSIFAIADISIALKSLDGLFRSLQNLKSLDIGSLVRSVSDLIRTLTEIDLNSLKSQDFKEFPKLAEYLAKGIRVFNRVRVNAENLNAVSTLLEKVSQFQKEARQSLQNTSKLNTQAFDVGTSLSESITDGVFQGLLRFELKKTITSVLIKAAQTLFPSSVFRRVDQAVKDFVNSVGTSLREIGSNAREVGDDLFDFGERLLSGPFSIIGVMNSESFGLAADFDALSTQLQVFGGLTEEQTRRAQEFANTIGIEYPLSSNEALSAILDLIKAGQDLDSVEFILPAAADLAALSDTGSIENTTQILIGAASSFRDFTDEVTGTYENIAIAADLLTAGADVSTASVESLGEGLGNAQAVASAFGLSMEETVAALGIFDNASVKGAEGGTLLRSVLNSLQSTRARDELARLGYSIDDIMADAEGNRRPLNDIIDQLKQIIYFDDAGNSRTEADRAQILTNLADTYGRTGLAILLQQDAGALNDFMVAMEGSGTASEKAGSLLDNFKGDLEQLQGSAETLTTRALLPLLNNAFRPLIQVSRKVVDAFLTMPDAFFDVVANVIALVTGAVSLGGALAVVSGIAIKLSGVLLIVSGGFLSFLTNLLPLVTSVGAVAASFGVIIAAGLIIIPTLIAIGASIKAVMDAVRNNTAGAGDAFQRFKDSVHAVFEAIGSVVSAVGNILAPLRDSIAGPQGALALGSGLADVFNTLADRVNTATKPFRDFAEGASLASGLFSDWLGIGSSAQAAADRANAITSSMSGGMAATATATDYANIMLERYYDRLEEASQSPLLQRIFGDENLTPEKIVTYFTNFKLGIENVGRSLVQLGSAVPRLLFGDENAREAVVSNLSNILEYATQFLDNFTDADLGSAILKFRQEDIQGGIDILVGQVLTGIRDKFLENADQLEDIAKNLASLLIPGALLADIIQALGLTEIANIMNAAIASIENFVRNTIGTIFDVLRGQNLVEALVGNFGGERGLAIARIFQSIGSAISRIGTIISEVIDVLFPRNLDPNSGENILTKAFEAIAGALEFVSDVILQGLVRATRPLLTVLKGLLTVLGSLASALFTFLDGTILTFLRELTQGESFLESLKNLFSNIFSGLPEIVNTVTNTLGEVLGPNFLGDFAASLFGTDTKNEEQSIGQAILGKIVNGIQALPQLIATGLFNLSASVTNPVLASFLSDMAANIEEGNFLAALGLIAGGFLGLIKNAIQALPQLLATGLFNLSASVTNPVFASFLSDMAANIEGGNFSEAIGLIANGLITIIRGAIEAIPSLISSGISGLGNILEGVNLLPEDAELTGPEGGIDLTGVATSLVSLISSAVQSIPDHIGTAFEEIGNLIGSPFLTELGAQLSAGNFERFFTSVREGFSKLVTDAVTGLTGLAGTAFVGVENLIGSPFLTTLGTQLKEGNFGQALATAGNGFLDIVGQSVRFTGGLIGGGLIAIGDLIGSPLLTQLGTQLQEGKFLGAITTAAGGILTFVSSAISFAISEIPNFITNLGILFGSPILQQLGKALSEGKTADAASLAAEGIGNLVTGAVDWVINNFDFLEPVQRLVNEIGSTLSSGDLIFPESIGAGIGTMVESLVSIPAELGGQVTDLIGNLGRLKDLVSGPQGLLFALGIGMLAVKMGLFETALRGIGGAARAFVNSPIVQVVAVLLLLKGALEGINTFLETGNIGQAIGAAIIDIGSTALGLVGIDVDEEAIAQTWSNVIAIVENGLRRIANSVVIGFRNVIDGIANEFNRAVLGILGGLADIGIGDQANANLRNAFNAINDTFASGDISSKDLFNQIGESLASVDSEQLGVLKTQLRTNYAQVMGAFRETIPDLDGMSDDEIANIVNTLINTGAFEEALSEVGAESEVFSRFIQAAVNAPIGTINFDAVLSELSLQAQALQLDPTAAINTAIQFAVTGRVSEESARNTINDIINQLESSGAITEEQAVGLRAQVDFAIDTGMVEAEARDAVNDGFRDFTVSINGVPMTIGVDPTIEFDDSNGSIQSQIWTLIQGASVRNVDGSIQEGPVQIPVDVALQAILSYQESGLITEEEAANFIENLAFYANAQIDNVVLTPEATVTLDNTPTVAIPGADGGTITVPIEEARLAPEETTLVPGETPTQIASEGAEGAETPTIETQADLTVRFIADPEQVAEEQAAALQEAYAQANASTDNPEAIVVTSSTDAGLFADNMLILGQRITEAKDNLTDLNTASGTFGVEFPVNTQMAVEYWISNVSPVVVEAGIWASNIRSVTSGVQLLNNTLSIYTATIVENLGLIGSAFTRMVDAAIAPLDKLAERIGSLAKDIGSLGSAANAAGGAAGAAPDSNPEGRAKGGAVFAGELYEVAENGLTELLKMGNRTYLIPGSNGYVVPMSAPPASSFAGAKSGSVNTSSVVYNINVDATGAGSPQEIAKAVRQEIERGERRNNVTRNLTVKGVS